MARSSKITSLVARLKKAVRRDKLRFLPSSRSVVGEGEHSQRSCCGGTTVFRCVSSIRLVETQSGRHEGRGLASTASHRVRRAHAGKEHGVGSSSAVRHTLPTGGPECRSELFRNEPFDMTDPMRFIVRAEEPSVRRWRDISP